MFKPIAKPARDSVLFSLCVVTPVLPYSADLRRFLRFLRSNPPHMNQWLGLARSNPFRHTQKHRNTA